MAGQKLAGSAQRRAKGGILQHGSIRLAPDPVEARRATSLGGTGATSLAELSANSAPEALQAACVEAFERAVGGLEAGELTAEERAGADERVRKPATRLGIRTVGLRPANLKRALRQPIGSSGGGISHQFASLMPKTALAQGGVIWRRTSEKF